MFFMLTKAYSSPQLAFFWKTNFKSTVWTVHFEL